MFGPDPYSIPWNRPRTPTGERRIPEHAESGVGGSSCPPRRPLDRRSRAARERRLGPDRRQSRGPDDLPSAATLLLARSIAREVEVHVDAVRQRVEGIADHLAQDLRTDGKIADGELGRLRDESGESFVVYLRHVDRRGRTSTSDPNTILPDAIEGAVRRQALDRSRGRDASGPAGQRTWMSAPVIAEPPGRDALLVVSAPVLAGSRPDGAVAAVVHFGAIWDVIVGGHGSGQTVFALDRDGVPFVSSDAREVLPGMAMGESELVQRFRTSAGRASETMSFLWTVGGVSDAYLGSYEMTRVGWGIFVQAPAGRRLPAGPAHGREHADLGAAALGLAVLAAIVLRPHRCRTRSSGWRRPRGPSPTGDFSTRVAVRSRNEIGELADTFNTMADEIEEHIRRLEARGRGEQASCSSGTIRALAQAIDAKDPYTRGHSVRVNRYSVILARQLGLSDEQIRDIHVASLMHDVGKIGIDDAILKKPGKLTDEEFEVMKTHTDAGREHHGADPQMKRDASPDCAGTTSAGSGGGYPDGLHGEEIPLMARIIAVADTFDAMTTNAPVPEARTFDRGRCDAAQRAQGTRSRRARRRGVQPRLRRGRVRDGPDGCRGRRPQDGGRHGTRDRLTALST